MSRHHQLAFVLAAATFAGGWLSHGPAAAQQSCRNQMGPLAWSCDGPLPGMVCTQINEPADPHTWNDNFLCAAEDFGIRWSFAGPIPGMRCTQIVEPAEPAKHTWNDNFLCVPHGLPFHFRWNFAGPIPGMRCLRWHEPADPHTWNDNFLCWEHNRGPGGAMPPRGY